jgi:hypothetical protein
VISEGGGSNDAAKKEGLAIGADRQSTCPPSPHQMLQQLGQLTMSASPANDAGALGQVGNEHAESREVETRVERLLQEFDDSRLHRLNEDIVRDVLAQNHDRKFLELGGLERGEDRAELGRLELRVRDDQARPMVEDGLPKVAGAEAAPRERVAAPIERHGDLLGLGLVGVDD